MDFFGISSVTYDNFRIDRIGSASEYNEIIRKIREEKCHYQTGELIIDIPGSIKTIEEALYLGDLRTSRIIKKINDERIKILSELEKIDLICACETY